MTDSEIIGALIAGKYKIKRRIGVGGMGAVYEAEHVDIGKRVAIKVIEHEHARSDELAQRFKREARAASAVESEHIVQVFDVGTDERVGLYMVMEILAGEDLATRIEKSGGRVPVDDVVSIGMQTARGLARAHAAGVVHRDLKPANLFLTTREDGSTCVKILDFGISKLARNDTDDAAHMLTRAGAVMGTPMYMSPEQAQGLPVDARADLWSLAVVLYEALAGRTPFDQRDTYEQMIVQIVTQRPKALAVIAPWVPAAIATVLEGALAHEVNERTADASTFGRQLAEAARLPASSPSSPDLGAQAEPPSSSRGGSVARAATDVGVVVARADAPTRRGRGVMIGAAVAAVAVIGLVIAMGARSKEPTPTAGAGLVADRGPDPVASAMTSATPVTSTRLIATGTPSADPAPSAAASASAAATASTAPRVAPRPAGAPTPRATATGAAPAPANTQVGGMGLGKW